MMSKTRATAALLDREPPHDFDAERALLGSMLLDTGTIPDGAAALRDGAAEFWSEKHRTLFSVIVELSSEKRAIDGVVIKNELVRRGQFEALGGYDFLAGLVASVPSAHRIREYAAVVHEKYVLRSVITHAGRILNSAYGHAGNGRPDATADEVVAWFSDSAARVADLAMSRGASSGAIAETIDCVVAEMIEPTHESRGVQTGFFGLDNLIGGLKPANLMVIGARTNCGKTALALNIADFIAVERNVPVIFVSIEMQASEVLQRLVEARSGIGSRMDFPDRADRWIEAKEQLKAAPIRLVDDLVYIEDIVNYARVVAREFPPDPAPVLVVDYLQIIRTRRHFETEALRLSHISLALKTECGKELGLRVIAPAQVNREGPKEERPPRLHDLRGCGSIEQDADIVAFIHQSAEARQQQSDGDDLVKDGIMSGEADIIVAKQRGGPKGSLKLAFNGACVRFENPYRQDSFDENQFSYGVATK